MGGLAPFGGNPWNWHWVAWNWHWLELGEELALGRFGRRTDQQLADNARRTLGTLGELGAGSEQNNSREKKEERGATTECY